uniref:Exocyst complex component SEC5 n=1 Tax=Zea mays TaxID=4577 RepID=A0A804MWB8_MAIZE
MLRSHHHSLIASRTCTDPPTTRGNRRNTNPHARRHRHTNPLLLLPCIKAAAASSPNPSSFSPGVGREREKAAIAVHPLYERLLEAHVPCLHVATPVDQLPCIDAQIVTRPPAARHGHRGHDRGRAVRRGGARPLHVLRVWDVLLFEGNRMMLFQTALALMELYGPALVTTKDAGDAVTLLQSLAGSTFDKEQSNDLTDGDKNQEANCSNVDDMYHGLTVNSEIDSLPDPKDQGLNKEFSYNKNLIDLKKEFCCNGTVVQDPELGPAIQLQSDQRKNGLMEKSQGLDPNMRDKVIYSSPNFDPKVFFLWVHKDTSAADLEAGALTLKTDLKGRTQQKKQLVKENFDCFVSCKTTIDDIESKLR